MVRLTAFLLVVMATVTLAQSAGDSNKGEGLINGQQARNLRKKEKKGKSGKRGKHGKTKVTTESMTDDEFDSTTRIFEYEDDETSYGTVDYEDDKTSSGTVGYEEYDESSSGTVEYDDDEGYDSSIEYVCRNGVPGIESNGVCCETSCGQCGGAGCSSVGNGAESCCTSTILEFGEVCGSAPCII